MILSRDNTDALFRNYSEFFEERTKREKGNLFYKRRDDADLDKDDIDNQEIRNRLFKDVVF